jgi:hypothetical protein
MIDDDHEKTGALEPDVNVEDDEELGDEEADEKLDDDYDDDVLQDEDEEVQKGTVTEIM